MLKLKLCILIGLLLVFLSCGRVFAGPEARYGDPDIYEGVRVKDEPSQWQLGIPEQPGLTVHIPLLGRIAIERQEQEYHLRKTAERLPAALKEDLTRR